MSSVGTLAKPVAGGVPWKAAQVAALHRTIEKLLAAPTLRGAQVGLIAIDTVRGGTLYSQNADQEFMPASNFKLLVGSAALNILGTGFTYATSLSSDRPPQNGAIAGNVYLRGGGDALLTAKDLDDAAAAVAAQGVTSISGSVVTDATHFDSVRYGYGWSWDDFPYYYAPIVTALELEDGIVHMYFSPGAAAGEPARITIQPSSSAFTVDNRLVTGPPKSKDTSELVRPWDEPTTIRITGSYPLDAKTSGDVKPTVPDPQSYAGDVLAKAFSAHGVAVAGQTQNGKTPAGTTLLWTKHSEAMPQLLADFWYPSANFIG